MRQLIKAGSQYIWLWVAIEPQNRQILALNISKERNMFIAERFIADLVRIHRKHPVSTDGGTWYPQACRFLKVNHHIVFLFGEKLDRKNDAVTSRTEQKVSTITFPVS